MSGSSTVSRDLAGSTSRWDNRPRPAISSWSWPDPGAAITSRLLRRLMSAVPAGFPHPARGCDQRCPAPPAGWQPGRGRRALPPGAHAAADRAGRGAGPQEGGWVQVTVVGAVAAVKPAGGRSGPSPRTTCLKASHLCRARFRSTRGGRPLDRDVTLMALSSAATGARLNSGRGSGTSAAPHPRTTRGSTHADMAHLLSR